MAEGSFVDFAKEVSWGVVSLTMKDNGLGRALNHGSQILTKEVYARLQYFAPQIEADMKVSAPWTDQTGNARNGLAARAYEQGNGAEMGIVLYHQVPYGIFLETRWSGKYAVISPAMQKWAPQVFAGLNGVMTRTNFT